MNAETFVRFMKHVAIDPTPGACWTWTGSKPDDRYGHFSLNGEAVKAHRWIYEAVIGPIPEGLLVRHRCDNPQCVNPTHLEPGTSKDNAQDKVQRGRCYDRKGERHPLAKLNAAKVLEIRRRAGLGETQKMLSAAFGVRHGQIGKIIRRQNWSHI